MNKQKYNLAVAPITTPLFVVLVLVLLSLSGYILQNRMQGENIYLLISVVQLIVFIFPCMLYYFFKGRKLSTPILVSAVKPGQYLFLLFSFFLLVSGTILIKFFFYINSGSSPSEVNFFVSSLASNDSAGVAETLVSFVIIPAICEELFFRGIVLSEYRTFGAFNAVVMSAICFSMAHFSFEASPIYFFSGIILGVSAIVCRSIFAPLLIHIGSNILSVYASDLFLRVTIQKCGAFFVGFVILTVFLISLTLVISRAEAIFWVRSEKPSQDEIPIHSYGNFKTVFLSPAFFILVLAYVLITILL
ncbi:MAG: CPBP family intramembrane glutamic endopeptidase [Clostridia bacterium]